MSKIDGGATLWARQTIDSDIFFNKPDVWFKIWFYLVNQVNHKDDKRFKRGTCFLKYDWIMDKTGATKNQVKHCIEYLKKDKMLATQKATRGFIVKVNKYNDFQTLDNYKKPQEKESKRNTEGTQKEHRSHTINKYGKYGKNDKKKRERAPAVFLTEEEYQKLVNELSKSVAKEYIKDLSLYLQSTGKQYKSHYATILAWHRRDEKQDKIKKSKEPEVSYEKYQSKKVSKTEAERYKNTAKEGIKILTGKKGDRVYD